MTKEILNTLSTGDVVKNTKTNDTLIVVAFAGDIVSTITIDKITPVEDWELQRSRFLVTKEEKAGIEEYHKKMAEQTINKR